MIYSAVSKLENISLPENLTAFDSATGKSVTLKELAQKRAEVESERFHREAISFSDSIRQENWQIISDRFKDLLDEKYNEEFLAPADYAYSVSRRLLHIINDSLGYDMLIPVFIVPDGEGGIRVEWKNNDKHVRLSLSEQRVYMYFEHNSDYDVNEDFEIQELIEKLRWLNQ